MRVESIACLFSLASAHVLVNTNVAEHMRQKTLQRRRFLDQVSSRLPRSVANESNESPYRLHGCPRAPCSRITLMLLLLGRRFAKLEPRLCLRSQMTGLTAQSLEQDGGSRVKQPLRVAMLETVLGANGGNAQDELQRVV